jgi:hypothetical protein
VEVFVAGSVEWGGAMEVLTANKPERMAVGVQPQDQGLDPAGGLVSVVREGLALEVPVLKGFPLSRKISKYNRILADGELCFVEDRVFGRDIQKRGCWEGREGR